ncbi:TPA_asm: DUF2197 domain-containing protein [Listeria monocytogenes]|nr:DUF2197 domain-containing protein [Listeria monocytogenes]EAG7630904.1 DUF2197 domain-containing protein [Listeria monocytogenes]EAG7634800.1 DUF2197 domain-containing protein [Listeria monocytogenes]EAG7649228.1 DUF2197 domain-containing protein [Listeria monocytogenes]EAG8266828.1 DUF2197 domain-containing protein [Listeria monocytogenes]
MNAKCILCERVDELDNREFKTKQLRNKPIRMYLCPECEHRVAINTISRVNSVHFNFHKPVVISNSELKNMLEHNKETISE